MVLIVNVNLCSLVNK